jgi:hypothetical protein
MKADSVRSPSIDGGGAWYAAGQVTRQLALAALSPLLEKNALKTVAFDVPVVFSMSRVIVIAFAVALLRHIWKAGVAGWPDATLAIAIVLALPLLSAFERVKASDVVELANTLLSRFGVGAVRTTGSVYTTEPSKHDDHRNDGNIG